MTAAVVGLGAIGSPMAWLLAQSGITLRLIDSDQVSLSNLPRQVLYQDGDLGRPKADVLAERLGHPTWARVARVDRDSAPSLLEGVDLVVDGTDNWNSRLEVDRWCGQHRKPWLFMSALRWEAMTALLEPDGPCLRCLFGEGQSGPACFDVGIVGPVGGWVAGMGFSLLDQWRQGGHPRTLMCLDGWADSVWAVQLPDQACRHRGAEDVG